MRKRDVRKGLLNPQNQQWDITHRPFTTTTVQRIGIGIGAGAQLPRDVWVRTDHLPIDRTKSVTKPTNALFTHPVDRCALREGNGRQ